MFASVANVLYAVSLSLAATAGAAATDLVAYDGFEYPASFSLAGANGGTGWAGPWADVGALSTGVGAAGLEWPDLAIAGGTAKTNASASFEYSVYQRPLPSFETPDNTVYVSFLLRPNAGYGTGGGLRFGNWPYTMTVGAHPGNYMYGLMTTNGLGDDSNVPVIEGTTVLLVARIAKNVNNTITYALYVDPTVGALQPAFPDAAYTSPGAMPQFVQIFNDGGFSTDEIRVGTTWASVLPTPPACVGDFNGTGIVDGADLGFLLAFWNLPEGDLNGDGTTDGADLGILLASWGVCP
ncbi:MAG: hypothetical protein KDA22_08780 [Phycisphaerales bacterium]|nr:hypothetical protein [Phycisphaerales bacterium]